MPKLYDEPDEDLAPVEKAADNRCTPDKLLAFVLRIGRCPTLADCKQEFGGTLGARVDHWTLLKQGRWPKFNKDGSIAR